MQKPFLLLVFISIYSSFCLAQSDEPFYEQIAFEFYCSEILAKSEIDLRLKINGHLNYVNYISADCLKEKIINEKNFTIKPKNNFDTLFLELKNINKKKFKIVKKINTNTNKENYLLVSRSLEVENRIFVIINEMVNVNGRGFTFEFDSAGNIIDWC
ncbi:hypothetical protein GFJ94_06325 [Flavobacterium sp. LMO8]|uniref:hypothetical protein n=1 Tax=Flavobacterium sp. LMO8 TaxID=2654244 RepID=UPI0012922085|nr:hypothetical protein [Flavobacterium sp. LMO8]MQP24676.1 hypothetical protein [Flavobacterium sp. LMO8]